MNDDGVVGKTGISSDDPVWDLAKPRFNKNGYCFHQYWDPVRKKSVNRMQHTLIWERLNNRKVPEGYCIHHRDNNPGNNRAENLLCIPVILHLELHARLRKAGRKFDGLVLEVERHKITEEIIHRAKELEELWSLM